tara:strand:- start:98 stop:295 length:198 start_codon:yes stop_codon:yes gene_type:complete
MSKENFYWQNDTWGVIHTENGETLEMNLWTCDNSGRQYITFYPELTNNVKDSNKVLANYEVNKKE